VSDRAARLGLVILAVGDLPRALAFYRSAFGWRQLVDVPVYGEFELPGGMRLGV
jgi:catechol 2,3-dioxygenase-like lactoylglutathione lyase family enzyme